MSLHAISHPLVLHKISMLRDINTGSKEFRELVSEIAMLICFEATKDLPLKEVEIETPVAMAKTKVLADKKIAFVPVLRAGLGMVAMQNTAAVTCFWIQNIQNSFYVLDLVTRFKDYAKYPITIFSSVFRFIFTFMIPIAFIAYYPSLVVLRPDATPILSWISPFIGIIFFWLSYKFWMYGAIKYSGTGS